MVGLSLTIIIAVGFTATAKKKITSPSIELWVTEAKLTLLLGTVRPSNDTQGLRATSSIETFGSKLMLSLGNAHPSVVTGKIHLTQTPKSGV